MSKITEIDFLSKYIRSIEINSKGIIKDSTSKNLEIYRNNYTQSLLNVLKTKFIATQILLEENFNYFSYKYVKVKTSSHPNIDFYGEDFPDFLSQQEELKDAPFMRNIALIDAFWFELNAEKQIRLPSNSLRMWKNVINGITEELLIDENILETISIKESGEHFQLESQKD